MLGEHPLRQYPFRGSAFVLVLYPQSLYDRGMTEAIAFDTHRYVKRLTENGFTERQAETLADEHIALLNANLATKADIGAIHDGIAKVEAGTDALRQETKTDIARVEAGMNVLRQETRADIAKVETRMEAIKSDLMKWMLGALIAQGGLVVALVRLV